MSDSETNPTAAGSDAASQELLADAWGAVARTALVAEGNSFQVWSRLSLVNRAWRDGLRGAHIWPGPGDTVLLCDAPLISGLCICFTAVLLLLHKCTFVQSARLGQCVDCSLLTNIAESDRYAGRCGPPDFGESLSEPQSVAVVDHRPAAEHHLPCVWEHVASHHGVGASQLRPRPC